MTRFILLRGFRRTTRPQDAPRQGYITGYKALNLYPQPAKKRLVWRAFERARQRYALPDLALAPAPRSLGVRGVRLRDDLVRVRRALQGRVALGNDRFWRDSDLRALAGAQPQQLAREAL